MSTYTSEPGTRLAGRYRLVDQVTSGTGWTYWKATDETLARSVTVLTFATGFPRVTETVSAARAASRLGDPRFSQVFDVEDGEELAYVVLEWVAAESLLDMLSEGPLEPPRAAALMVEAARAIAVAHEIGLAHLRLDPACLHWTAAGGVKIAGLGIDAALAGPALTAPADDAEDPQLTDTRDLARLLYAALTGYWPALPGSAGDSAPGLLPPAPAARAVISIVIVLVLAAVGVAAWSVSRSLHHSPTTTPSQSSSASSSPSTAAAAVPLKPVSASVYNPAPGSSGDDDPAGASAAIDSDTSTSWHTSFYFSPFFG